MILPACTRYPFFLFALLVFSGVLTPANLGAQACECRDKIYLNDPGEDVVHKFDLDPVTGGATEIGSPWFGPVPNLNPHGIAADSKGNVFVGQADGFGGTGVQGPLYELTCLGATVEDDFLEPENGIHYNIAARNGALYIPDNQAGTIRAYRICDGELIGRIDISTGTANFGSSWGFSIDETSWYFASRNNNGEVYSGTLDTTLYAPTPTNTGAVVFATGESGDFRQFAPMGITRDDTGNFYVIFNRLNGEIAAPEIRKYDADGNLLATISDDTDEFNVGNGGAGFWGARGITFSPATGLIYVSAKDNCLAVFNQDLEAQTALNVGNPTGSKAKGIGVIQECCPVATMMALDTTICLDQLDQSFALQDFLDCEGTFCEGTFTEVSSSPNLAYEECEANIVVSGQGCAVYTITSDGTNDNDFCGAFSIELNLCFVMEPTLAASATCSLDGANVPSFSVTAPVTSSPELAGEDVFLDINGTQVAAEVLDASGSFTFTDVATAEAPGANNIVAVRIGDNSTCVASAPVDFLSCAPGCTDGPGVIGGEAFSDINNDGADAGAGDVGLSNVEVRVYDCNDMLVCETATNANGEWSCSSLADGDDYRVEFATPSGSDLQPARSGTDNGTATQIITSPTCGVNVGYLTSEACPPAVIETHDLGDLSSEGILLSSGLTVITCGSIVDNAFPPESQFTLGLIDVRDITFGDFRPTAALIDFHHPDWTATRIGNVFGTAVDDEGTFYTTASSHYGASYGYGSGSNFRPAVIRYGEIGGGRDAAEAAGTVYRMDPVTGEPSVWAQLPQQLSTFRTIGCERTVSDFTRTTGVGLGNIDFDKANRQFFVSNFEDGRIYRLSMDGDILDSFDPQTLPGFTADDGTAGFASDFKPYGLETSADGRRLYFGAHVVDDDPNTSLITAGVYFVALTEDGSFDGTENLLVNVTADPATGRPLDNFNAFGRDPGWVSASDLEFNPDGNLVIGLRTGCGENNLPVFASSHNHGATYAIYNFGDGSLQNVETRYSGDEPANAGTGNDDVYGGIGIWDKKNGDYTYVVSSSDIVNELGPHGIMLFPDDFTQSGTSANSFILKPSAALPYFANLTSNDFKGVGGDVEVYSPCGPIVLEIGNYAWIDEDGDGVQDPCEPPLAGLTVNLYSQPGDGSAPVLLATTTTDADGQYYFSSADNDGSRVSWLTAEDEVVTGNDYVVAFTSDEGFNPNNGILSVVDEDYQITTPDATAKNGNDQNDSDVTLQTIGGVSFAVYRTQAGEVDNSNHTFDAGFVPIVYDLALRKTLGDNGTAVAFAPGDEIVFDLEVINQGTNTSFDIVVGDQLPTGLSYVGINGPTLTTAAGGTTGVTAGTTTGQVLDFTLDSLRAGDSVSIALTLLIDDPYTGQFPIVNTAEIQSFDNDMDAGTAAPTDEDSTPDDNFANDAGGGINNPADNVTTGDGSGFPNDGNAAGDEDDADSEAVPYYDVALTKTLDAASLGDNNLADADELLDFTVTVVNQGNLPVRDVVVFDDVPCGFDFVGAGGGTAPVNVAFTGDNTGATATIAGPLASGATATISIQLRVRGTGELDAACMADAMRFVNRAEIASIDPDGPGGDDPLESDFDSVFDEADDTEDGGGVPNGNTDNAVGGNGSGVLGSDDPATDDDDEDPAGTEVVDIALAKVIDEAGSGAGDGPPYRINDLVKFDIQLTNQGTQPIRNIDVVDVLPNGLEYEATVGDADWAYDTGTRTATATFAGPLTSMAPTATISIFARIVAPTGDPAEDYLNVAEVSEIDAEVTDFSDRNMAMVFITLTQDADSPLNADVTDNTGGRPGTDDDNNINGGGPAQNEDQDNADPVLVDVALLSLGSTVFLDQANNGVQDAGDPGIAGVEVQLFDAVTGTQILTTADGVVTTNPAEAGTVVTDADGNYLFSNIQPGDYFVTLPMAPASAPISSNATTSGFTETDPDDDVDGDDDGVQDGGSGTAVTSGVITLAPLDEPENEPGQGGAQDTSVMTGLLDNNGNMTLDFGLFAPIDIGNQVFIDLNGDGLRDPTEEGLAGVSVTLIDAVTMLPVTTDADGNPLDPRTTTDADGNYSFENLPPGNYLLSIDIGTAPRSDFYDFTAPNAGDDGIDSDAAPASPRDDVATSEPTGFLLSGTSVQSLTAGVVCALEVVPLMPFTVCSTQPIVLDSVATILQDDLEGEWTTDGDGTFLDALGKEVTAATNRTDAVVSYLAGPEDAAAGMVTLTLTTDDPGAVTPPSVCPPVSSSATIQILKVDCGSFFWDGE